MSDRDAAGPGDPADRFSGLLGSGAQPGGAGGLDFADLTGSIQQLLADSEAMGALRRYLDEGRGLRSALEATAETVPSAGRRSSTCSRTPGSSTTWARRSVTSIAGGGAPASGEGGPSPESLPGILGILLGGAR